MIYVLGMELVTRAQRRARQKKTRRSVGLVGVVFVQQSFLNDIMYFFSGSNWSFMFPNANDFPTSFSQSFCSVYVAFLILPDLVSPKHSVGFCLCSMNWTTMPETPVDKNCYFCRTKNNICPSIQFLNGFDVNPETQALSMECRT